MHYNENEYDLVLFTQTFYPDVDATAKLMTDLAEFLVEKGEKVLIVTPNRSYEVPENKYPEFEIINGISVKRVKVPKLNKNNALQKILLYYLFSIKAKKTLKKTNYKVAMAILPPFFVAYNTLRVSKKKGNKFIFLLHDLHPDTLVRRKQVSPKNPVVKLLKKQNEYVFQNADKVIFLGRDQIEYVKENYNIQNEKIEYIPNWGRKSLKSPSNKNINTFKILYAGNLGESSKNMFDFLEIMKELQENKMDEFKLTILGEGRNKEKYLDYINKNGLYNVELKSFLPEDEYEEELRNSNLFLVTLREESKGMSVPSKVYYYLSAGKPIIGILPVESEIDISIKEDNYGVNLNRICKNERIDTLLKLKNDHTYYSQLSENAKKAFEKKYEKNVVLEKYYKIITELEADEWKLP